MNLFLDWWRTTCSASWFRVEYTKYTIITKQHTHKTRKIGLIDQKTQSSAQAERSAWMRLISFTPSLFLFLTGFIPLAT